MAINLEGIVTWLKGWFYDKTEITGFLNNKANQSDLQTLQGTVTSLGETVNGKIDTAGTGLSKSGTTLNHSNSITEQTSTVFKKIKYDGQGHITGTENVGASDLPSHSHSVSDVSDNNAHSNIGTSANATQGAINTAIDTAIGNLQSIKAIEVVSTLDDPVTEVNMGKLYIISENSKINVYYAVRSGTSPNYSYSWHKMDADILDELVVNWSDVQNNPFSSHTPSSFADASHGHGNITNDGRLVTSVSFENSDSIVITDFSDNSKIKRVSNILTSRIKDSTAYSHIGTSANATQDTINTAINTALGNKLSATKVTNWSGTTSDSNVPSEKLVKDSLDAKASASDLITSIYLVPKNTDANGKIIFYTGDEPT